MQSDVIVRQLRTNSGHTYVNILDDFQGAGIGLWGSLLEHPTYLVFQGMSWVIVTFDDEAWRDQELPKFIRRWKADRVLELPGMTEYKPAPDDGRRGR